MQHASSLKDILEFRQTVHLMQTDYPFSRLFGRADNREACVASSAKVYDRLVDSQLESTNLQFSTIAKITAANGDGRQNEKLKRLMNLFRPNKDKELTLLDFTRVRGKFLWKRYAHSDLLFSHKFSYLYFLYSLWIQYTESFVRFRQVLATRQLSTVCSK